MTEPPTLVLAGARILAPEAPQGCTPPTDIVVAGDRIAALLPAGAAPAAETVIDARRLLVAPGLVNGHHHSHENFLKGRFEGRPLELVMNFVRPLEPVMLTERQVYVRTMISALQALRTGTTTIVDDMSIGPMSGPSHVEAALAAYEDCGIRALLGPTLFDRPFFRALPFVDEEFPPELLARLDAMPARSAADLVALARRLARERHPREHRVGFILAPSAPQRCTDGFLTEVRRLADEFALPVIIHVHETRLQSVTAGLFYGRSMFRHLAGIGFLAPATSLVHAVWITPEDMRVIAESGASVQHNPTVNLKLGSGLMPMREMLDAGINVSLGTDGCGLVECADMLRALANTALVQKLRGDDHDRWIGARDAFHAATAGGARALGMEDRIGAIAPGMKADLCCFDLGSLAFVPLNDAVRQLVYGETGGGLDTVLVDGRPVMRGDAILTVDEAAILDEARAIHEEIAGRLDAVEASVQPLLAPYDRIFARCLCHPIDPTTLPARFSASGIPTSTA